MLDDGCQLSVRGVNGCQAVTGVSQVTAADVRCWVDKFQHELLGSVNYIPFFLIIINIIKNEIKINKLNYITVLVQSRATFICKLNNKNICVIY